MTCRSMDAPRYAVTNASKWPRRCTRCRATRSGARWRPGPTRSWSKVVRPDRNRQGPTTTAPASRSAVQLDKAITPFQTTPAEREHIVGPGRSDTLVSRNNLPGGTAVARVHSDSRIRLTVTTMAVRRPPQQCRTASHFVQSVAGRHPHSFVAEPAVMRRATTGSISLQSLDLD